jgi:imidazoleglycerol-phosphate dehydratase
LKRTNQGLTLRIGADGNAQMLVDARQLEVANDDLALAQIGREHRRIVLRVADEDEVGGRRQDVETQPLQVGDQRRPAAHDGLARGFQIGLVGHRGGRTGNRQAVKRVGIETVLDAFQALDQRAVTDRVTDAQSGQRVRFGQRADDQQVGMAIDQCDRRFSAEVDIGLIDDDRRLRMQSEQAFDRDQRHQLASRGVGVGDDDAAIRARIVVDVDSKVVTERNRDVLDSVQLAIDRVEAVTDVGHQDRHFVLEQRHENMRQHFVGAVAEKDLRRLHTEHSEVFGNGRLEAIAVRVGVEAQVRAVAAQFGLHRRQRERRRRVGVLVGVELDEVLDLGLFARNVGRQAVNKGAPVGIHERLAGAECSGRLKWYHARVLDGRAGGRFAPDGRHARSILPLCNGAFMRQAEISRNTLETRITVRLNLDGSGQGKFTTAVPFLDHMLDQIARHGMIDLEVEAQGDLHIDAHHTVEDIGITIGQALAKAAGDKKGLRRYGHAYVPLDEALSRVVVDLSGRPGLSFNVDFTRALIGSFDVDLMHEFFQGLVNHALMTVHIDNLRGDNAHHQAETVFKAFGRALRMAVETDARAEGSIPSTKGTL